MMKRLDTLDCLRGLSVIGMIMVISPGSWMDVFSWLQHAPWEGIALADMIFPVFLFCVGMALPLSVEKQLERGILYVYVRIFYRSFSLIFLGILLNLPLSGSIEYLRIPGVLQRIGVCYLLCGLFYTRFCADRADDRILLNLMLSITSILLGYWLLLRYVPVPGGNGDIFGTEWSWPAYVDRLCFGTSHLWRYGTTGGRVTFDPEGVLSSIPAMVNVLIGVFTAILVRSKSHTFVLITCIIAGCLMMFFSLIFAPYFPIIKQLWTSTFALFSAGFALTLFSLMHFSLSKGTYVNGLITKLLSVFGANALLGFVISWLLLAVLDKPVSLFGYEYAIRELVFNFYAQFVQNNHVASLLFALTITLLIYILLLPLYYRRIYIRF